jgi:hypothetical protein
MAEPLRIRTMAQLRAVISAGSSLVITDSAKAPVFHPVPDECTHVREVYFETKVTENGERNGSYFSIPSLSAARPHWPDIAQCRSPACSAVETADSGESECGEPGQLLRTILGAATGSHQVRNRPEPPAGVEALMTNWATTQRIALGESDGSFVLCAWPAELKAQAGAVYGTAVGREIVELVESSDEWTAEPLPHLAFNNARRPDRFYFRCTLPLAEYVARWSRPEDLSEVRGHPADPVRTRLWPWLCARGYADPTDPGSGPGLDRYLETLGRRRSEAHIRPSIALRKRCLSRDERGLRNEVTTGVGDLAVVLRETLPPQADLCRGWTARDVGAAIDLATEEQWSILLVMAENHGIDIQGVAVLLGYPKWQNIAGRMAHFAKVTDPLGILDPADGKPSWPLEHGGPTAESGFSRYLMPRAVARIVVARLGGPRPATRVRR